MAGEGFGEIDTGVTGEGIDFHPDFGELAGAAALFFVAVFGFAVAFDGFAVGDFGFDEVEVDFEPGFETLGEHLEVEFALAGDDCLVEFAVDVVEERLVFLVEGGEAGGDLVFFAFGFEAQGGVDIGFGVFDFGEFDGFFVQAERIAGVGILELDDGSDVAAEHLVHRVTILAVDAKDLAEAFVELSVGVIEFAA
ncbi:MAG: hypothetical protein RI897_2481 [Verrucomicrobiota bacterium]